MVIPDTAITGGEEVLQAATMIQFRVYQCISHICHLKNMELEEFVGSLQSFITLINQFRFLRRCYMFFFSFGIRCIRVIVIERIVISAFRAEPVSSCRAALGELPIQI
jgi:hypothetical protein